MRRFIIVLIGTLVIVTGTWPAYCADSQERNAAIGVPAFPPPTPSADEVPVEADGNAQTDSLLDCYSKFHGSAENSSEIGPPHITRSPQFGYILRADFPRKGDLSKVDRLVCSGGGFETQKNLPIPPLDSSPMSPPDPASARAIAGWKARREAEVNARMTARRFAPPDAATAHFLEGIWLVGDEPKEGPCISHWYKGTEIEFEFRKSGGRILIFEPTDLFTPIAISGIENEGDILSVQAEARGGGFETFLRIRKLSPDKIELLSKPGASRPGAVQTAYKCGEPDNSVNATVSLDALSIVAPPVSGGWNFPEVIPGVSDSDRCAGRGLNPKQAFGATSLQFELFGPVHYWLFGWETRLPDHHYVAFDFVRSVQQRDPHTLVLQMQEHLEKGEGWDVEASRGPNYQLTIIDHGDHIEVPELSANFVRCKPDSAASTGMHRW